MLRQVKEGGQAKGGVCERTEVVRACVTVHVRTYEGGEAEEEAGQRKLRQVVRRLFSRSALSPRWSPKLYVASL